MSQNCSIRGLDLSAAFYQQTVKPIIAKAFPSTKYSAALIGDGSEVLGFDTEMSQDHDWGPRVMLFFTDADYAVLAPTLQTRLSAELPKRFLGYLTDFKPSKEIDQSETIHHVEVLTPQMFFSEHLKFDLRNEIQPADWLTFTEQRLATIVTGRVFEDHIGLQEIRDRFAYYPKDIWLYLLACGWTRIEQESHLMGRAGYTGDELGSALIGARLVRDIMRLCFLMERKYAPYAKWFGTAFSQLQAAPHLTPILQQALSAQTWQDRERNLTKCYEYIATLHNRLAITEALPTTVKEFFDRPFLVISTGEFSKAILEKITDPTLTKLKDNRPIGSIDQFSDSTDLLTDPVWRTKLKELYN